MYPIFLLVIVASASWFFLTLEDKPACPEHGKRFIRGGRGSNQWGRWFRCRVQGCQWRQSEHQEPAETRVMAMT